MSNTDPFETDEFPALPTDDAAAPPSQAIEGADESLEPRHVHQIVEVRLGAGGESIFVSRTELLVEHSHALGDPGGDLWDEHARALGMTRPRPAGAAAPLPAPEPPDRRGERGRLRPRPLRHDAPALPAAGGFISFGSKSRLPTHMTRSQLDAYLKQERSIALDARDPLAISYAAERYTLISTVLQELSEGNVLDLSKPLLTVSQAAKILGYNTKEVRRLLGQGKIAGRKVGSEWRVPLRAVL